MRAEPGAADLLDGLARGAPGAAEKILPLVYRELRSLAGKLMRRERADHTLAPTALVHEAYLRLAGARGPAWEGRTHFYAVAAHAMRRILKDHARTKKRLKRGGSRRRVSLHESVVEDAGSPVDAEVLDEALDRLAATDERKAKIVELKFYAGLETSEIARLLSISTRSVERDWRFARAWLLAELM